MIVRFLIWIGLLATPEQDEWCARIDRELEAEGR